MVLPDTQQDLLKLAIEADYYALLTLKDLCLRKEAKKMAIDSFKNCADTIICRKPPSLSLSKLIDFACDSKYFNAQDFIDLGKSYVNLSGNTDVERLKIQCHWCSSLAGLIYEELGDGTYMLRINFKCHVDGCLGKLTRDAGELKMIFFKQKLY